ncbi:hypothetical protein AB3X82_20620 [Paraburkholderia phenoliruptrix]|uniref:Ryanodine receptor Ryr domain-containing protein n=1 Tax=Paraburkholderia phenoliruptrix TaxID=252970 RepID=A0ABV3WHX4_9BURK|nr:hypothetical protein [Paraburkholderia phenoliruptrix]MDR6392468.1 hypothetical protein [Paraburkholderia phenoliruptrix]
MPPFVPDEILEQLAAVEHERWAHWQRYMHGKAVRNSDGSLTIPAELVSRWERLMETPYTELTEDERRSDREQVQRYLPLLATIRKP